MYTKNEDFPRVGRKCTRGEHNGDAIDFMPASVTDNPSGPKECIASFDKNCGVNETDGVYDAVADVHEHGKERTDSTCSVSVQICEAVTVEIASLLPFPGTYFSSTPPRCLVSEAKVEACGSSETPEREENDWGTRLRLESFQLIVTCRGRDCFLI